MGGDRIYPEAAGNYLTHSIVKWLPLFVSQASCQIIADRLTYCTREKHLG